MHTFNQSAIEEMKGKVRQKKDNNSWIKRLIQEEEGIWYRGGFECLTINLVCIGRKQNSRSVTLSQE